MRCCTSVCFALICRIKVWMYIILVGVLYLILMYTSIATRSGSICKNHVDQKYFGKDLSKGPRAWKPFAFTFAFGVVESCPCSCPVYLPPRSLRLIDPCSLLLTVPWILPRPSQLRSSSSVRLVLSKRRRSIIPPSTIRSVRRSPLPVEPCLTLSNRSVGLPALQRTTRVVVGP